MAKKLSNNKKRRLTALADQAMALAGQGELASALQVCEQADIQSPNFPDILYARGLVASMQQDFTAATDWFGRAHRASPKRVEFMANYASCLLVLDREEEAAALFREVLRLSPRLLEAAYGLGASLASLGEFREAISVFEQALQRDPRHVKLLKKLASVFNSFGDTESALNLLKKAHAVAPNDVSVLHSIGVCLAQQGDMPAAQENLRLALKLDPDYVDAISILLDIGEEPDNRQKDIQSLRELYERVPSDSAERAVAAFTLGNEADKSGQYMKAFALWTEGNRIRHLTLNYDEQEQIAIHDCVEKAFTADRLSASHQNVLTDIAPVFIVGMPRSGSTLLEQALSRHPALQAGGELDALQQAIVGRGNKVRTKTLIQMIQHADDAEIAAIGHEYARRLVDEYQLTGRIIDKALTNYLYVGLIVRAIPNARVIHVTRDPMATCLSMYQQDFVESVSYTFDLTEMGRQYARYRRLMQHWQQTIPNEALVEVSYEDLVKHPERELRRLLGACGLEWDARCLSAHEAGGAVATASLYQVRKPIHQKSVARWQHYRQQLEPLKPYV